MSFLCPPLTVAASIIARKLTVFIFVLSMSAQDDDMLQSLDDLLEDAQAQGDDDLVQSCAKPIGQPGPARAGRDAVDENMLQSLDELLELEAPPLRPPPARPLTVRW